MIRPMTLNDILDITKLETKVFKETLGSTFFDNELNLNPFAKYYVYEINKEIIGYIGSRVYDDSIEIMNFLINPNYQRQGFGKELLDHLLNSFNDIKLVTLEVRKSNKQAITFYNKNGFVLDHVKKHYYNNEDAYFLVKEVL